MSKRASGWIIVALLIGVVLAGAYRIVERNNAVMEGSGQDVPAGVFH